MSIEITPAMVKSALIAEGVTILTAERFLAYWEKNPNVWRCFEAACIELIARGVRKYGAKGIMEKVRWDISLTTQGEFKIQNDYTAYFARAFLIKYPAYRGLFTTKKIRGLKVKEAA